MRRQCILQSVRNILIINIEEQLLTTKKKCLYESQELNEDRGSKLHVL